MANLLRYFCWILVCLFSANGQFLFSTTSFLSGINVNFVTCFLPYEDYYLYCQQSSLFKLTLSGVISPFISTEPGYLDGEWDTARFAGIVDVGIHDSSLLILELENGVYRLRNVTEGYVTTVNVTFNSITVRSFHLAGNYIFVNDDFSIIKRKNYRLVDSSWEDMSSILSTLHNLRGFSDGSFAFSMSSNSYRYDASGTLSFSFGASVFDVDDTDKSIYAISNSAVSHYNESGFEYEFSGAGDLKSVLAQEKPQFFAYLNGGMVALGLRTNTNSTQNLAITQYFRYSNIYEPVLIEGVHSEGKNLMSSTNLTLSMPCFEPDGTFVTLGLNFPVSSKTFLLFGNKSVNGTCNNSSSTFSKFQIDSSIEVTFYVTTTLTKKFQSISPSLWVYPFFENIPTQAIGNKTDSKLIIKGCSECPQSSILVGALLSQKLDLIFPSLCIDNSINLTDKFIFSRSGKTQIQYTCLSSGVIANSNQFEVLPCDKLDYVGSSSFNLNQCILCPAGTKQSQVENTKCQFCSKGEELSLLERECIPCQDDCFLPTRKYYPKEDFEFFMTPRTFLFEPKSFLPDNLEGALLSFYILSSIFITFFLFCILLLFFTYHSPGSLLSTFLKKCDIFFKRSKSDTNRTGEVVSNYLNKTYISSVSGGIISILFLIGVLCTCLGLIVDYSMVGFVLTPDTSETISTFSVPLNFHLKLYVIGGISSDETPKVNGIRGQYETRLSSNTSLYSGEIICTNCSISIPSSLIFFYIGSYISSLSWELLIETPFSEQSYFSQYGIFPPLDENGSPTYMINDKVTIFPTLTASDILYPDGTSEIGFQILNSQAPQFPSNSPTYYNSTIDLFPRGLEVVFSIVIPPQVNRYKVVRTKNLFVLITQCVSVMGGLFFIFKVIHKFLVRYTPLNQEFEMKRV